MGAGFDPYTPPQAQGPAPATADATARVFTPNQIGWATFLGTALAGGILLGINEKRLGRPGKTATMVGMGLVVTVLIMVAAVLLPEQVPAIVFSLPPVFALRAYAQHLHGDEVAAQIERAGKGSNWLVAGVCLGGLLIGALGMASVMLATGELDFLFESETQVPGGVVVYAGDLEEQARQVGRGLHDVGWFTDGGDAAARLTKDDDGYVVCLYVLDGAWNEAPTRDAARQVEQFLSEGQVPAPNVRVELCDANGTPQE